MGVALCPSPSYNDAKCAAMAEAGVGALADVEDGFVIILGTMIGGAYTHNRRLVMGRHFAAGEVSYILNGLDAPRARLRWGIQLRKCVHFAYSRTGCTRN